MPLEHAMEDFGTLLTLVGMSCCCISVFLIAIVGFSLAFRPKRTRASDVKGMAPAPVRGMATQASLTRMEEDVPAPRRASGEPRDARPAAPTRPVSIGPAAASPAPVSPAPPKPPPFVPPVPAARPLAEDDMTVRAPGGFPPPATRQVPPPVPGASVPPPVPGAGGPPPIPGAASPPPILRSSMSVPTAGLSPVGPAAAPVPPSAPGAGATRSGPPPIPPGTRLLLPSPTIAPGSGDDEPAPPPPRKV
ncbi:MAG: hypothetical protein Q8P41_17695 [Pseudomonadota bacterium]|nr:hypothetical protein [Pseudomonadota bacterium]